MRMLTIASGAATKLIKTSLLAYEMFKRRGHAGKWHKSRHRLRTRLEEVFMEADTCQMTNLHVVFFLIKDARMEIEMFWTYNGFWGSKVIFIHQKCCVYRESALQILHNLKDHFRRHDLTQHPTIPDPTRFINPSDWIFQPRCRRSMCCYSACNFHSQLFFSFSVASSSSPFMKHRV